MSRNCLMTLALMTSTTVAAQQPNRSRFQREAFQTDAPMVHDPVMAKDGDTYYIYATGMGIQQMTSKDRKTWTVSPNPVMTAIPGWTTDSVPGFGNHVWAPDVIQWHGRWWLAYSCSTFGKNGSAIGLLSSRSLSENKWKDEGCIVISHDWKKGADGKMTGDNWNAIDPNFVIDDNDQPWLVWGSFWDGIQLARLDSTMHMASGEKPRTIARRYAPGFKPTEPNPTSRFAGTNAIEAPFIFKHGGYYYLFVSWDYCCRGAQSNYRVAVGRSKTVDGPYLDPTGKDMANGGGKLFLEGDKKEWEAAGHCAAYNFDGEDIFICHGYSATRNGAAMLIQHPISWTADGWPELKRGATTSAQTSPIRIDLGQKGAEVSPNLYGIFFEEISHAGDGGLYAELVQNRGFEEHVLPSGMTYREGKAYAPDAMNYEHRNNRNWNIPWNLEEKKMTGWRIDGVKATVKGEIVEATSPLHVNTPHAMQLDITKMQMGGKAVLTNTGYWGMGLKQGDKYDLRFYVRSSNYRGNITARLVNGETGASLGTVTFTNKQLKDWTELTATLTAEGTAAKGELALEFDQKGTVLVDYVSLFPQATFKGRKNGQRADVAQMLVDLHPKFMRWPGGCIVEGATYENRVKWKETLGDPMTRRGEWDLWGYRATWGMGYHEFLQFCEDLGMDAMFVNNAGMSCSVRNGDFVSSDADMNAVVQDFRDAIDYALADPSKNKWAKMRAESGHPKPFPLKYVEIGNENVGPEYVTHFNYIFKRLKAEYPQITFINTLGHTDRLLEQIPGDYMVDPHWYRDPNFFFANNHLFDNAPRTHDIYVGEYACIGGVGAGNLLAALSEAAFIMGMERNSDVVKMSSYAPLFENENRRDWPCNLIHINSSEVYGRASYYVQQMASENRPTYNIYVNEPTSGDPKTTRHFCQTGYDEQTGELIIKVVNGTDQPYRRSFCIDGARTVLPAGKVITLNGDANDENTFLQPTKLAPKTTLFGKFGRQFDYEFSPMSFTILRVKVNK